MSEVFEGYERQYCDLSANLSRKCSSATLLAGEEQQQKISEIKAGLDEADILIRKMDLEARSLQPSVKAMLLAKLREYKSDLNKLKREVKRISSGTHDQAAREELLEAGISDAHKELFDHCTKVILQASSDQRERVAVSTERLNQSSERIRDSRRTVLETEQLGVSILEDLHQQRETLLHSHNKLHEADSAIDKSKKILTAMSRRISKNKWIVGGFIAALTLAILFILIFKLTHH
ncbi:Vesicle transport v-SNARE 12 [Ancistrocladus abbreviatus]